MRFLLHCIFAFISGILSPPCEYSWWEVLIGFLEIASIIAVFVVSIIFLAWYYAIAIAIGYIAVVCIIAVIIDKIRKNIKQ